MGELYWLKLQQLLPQLQLYDEQLSNGSAHVLPDSFAGELDGKFPDLVHVLHLHAEHQDGHVARLDEEGRNVGHLVGPT